MIDCIMKMPIPNLSQPVRSWRWEGNKIHRDNKKTCTLRNQQHTTAHPKNIITEEIYD